MRGEILSAKNIASVGGCATAGLSGACYVTAALPESLELGTLATRLGGGAITSGALATVLLFRKFIEWVVVVRESREAGPGYVYPKKRRQNLVQGGSTDVYGESDATGQVSNNIS